MDARITKSGKLEEKEKNKGKKVEKGKKTERKKKNQRGLNKEAHTVFARGKGNRIKGV